MCDGIFSQLCRRCPTQWDWISIKNSFTWLQLKNTSESLIIIHILKNESELLDIDIDTYTWDADHSPRHCLDLGWYLKWVFISLVFGIKTLLIGTNCSLLVAGIITYFHKCFQEEKSECTKPCRHFMEIRWYCAKVLHRLILLLLLSIFVLSAKLFYFPYIGQRERERYAC